ncbi:MAG TPA: hypothetical protein VFW33_12100, partial [Gemmataceae bacterium]|nr:hypothetical protein [Gemmataceae bacterium]
DGGVIRFSDAWIVPESLTADGEGVVRDVMTPHHPRWQTMPDVAPTDFDSPNPVAYLSAAGRFHVAVAWQGPEHSEQWKWSGLAFTLLKEALAQWGAGGKTSSGYGRLFDAADVAARAAPSAPAPPPTAAGGGVTVTVLERREGAGGRVSFIVQEQGRPKGVLMYGTQPAALPAVNDNIQVYRNNTDPRTPQYRWDPPRPPDPARRPPRRP